MVAFKRKPVMGSGGHTNPLVWLAAIICTIFAIAVIVIGIIMFIGYIMIHPRVPTISVTDGHLDLLRNDYAGLLQTQLSIVVTAHNGNAKAHAEFSKMTFSLSFQGQGIAVLVADSLDVLKNSSNVLRFVQSSSIPLTPVGSIQLLLLLIGCSLMRMSQLCSAAHQCHVCLEGRKPMVVFDEE